METERFNSFQCRVNGLIMPYTLIADDIFKGSFSKIINVSCVVSGKQFSSYTTWYL